MIALERASGRLAAELARRGPVLVAADFDGTLCEFKPRPEQARLSPRRRALLRALDAGPSRLAVLSGRGLTDLRGRVGIPGAVCAGNFGLEMAGGGVSYRHPGVDASRGALKELVREFEALSRAAAGAFVEDKRWGVALHFKRAAPASRRRLLGETARLRRDPRFAGLVWWRRGLAWEVVPDVGWDKGTAALWLWRRLGKPYLLAFGDDAVDEPLFQAVRGKGLAIRVGRSAASAAGYWAADVAAVYRFLGLLKSAGV